MILNKYAVLLIYICVIVLSLGCVTKTEGDDSGSDCDCARGKCAQAQKAASIYHTPEKTTEAAVIEGRLKKGMENLEKARGERDEKKQDVSRTEKTTLDLYNTMGLEDDMSFETFNRAMTGYRTYPYKKKNIITIVDYTKPSTRDRLFIIDLEKPELRYKTLVAHAKNTGQNFAEKFSNSDESKKNSPGFYATAETYYGKHGYSLRLDGQEPGINDNARRRAIVVHGADYVSKKFIKTHGRLGRSWGCPAVPIELSKEIIDTIKNGTCFYIHTKDKSYLRQSSIPGNQKP